MIEKPDTLTQEIMDLFKKKFPKRVDRDVWMCKYMMALTDIHLIEGLIGRRQEQKKPFNNSTTGEVWCGKNFPFGDNKDVTLGEERSSEVKDE